MTKEIKREVEEPSYLFATIPEEEAARLREEAEEFLDAEEFIRSLEYEDWMEAFTDAPDGEPMSEAEYEALAEAIRKVWEEAHQAGEEFPEDYAERRELADILISSPAWGGTTNPKELALHHEAEELKDLVRMIDEAEDEYYDDLDKGFDNE